MSSTNRGGTRNPADFYPTPRWCVLRALEEMALPGGEWIEPCAGDGAIVRAVQQARADVSWQAVELRETCRPLLEKSLSGKGRVVCTDFFDWDPARRFDVLFTNPPYSLAEQFLEKGLSIASNVVLLLRLNFLASARRAELMRRRAPDVYVLPNRPSFSGQGTDSVEYAWFHWPPEHRRRGSMVVLPSSSIDERRAGQHVTAE
ncbi:Phage protein [Minicystis rosea]|nr:Phage protein [Minicystis rosea]